MQGKLLSIMGGPLGTLTACGQLTDLIYSNIELKDNTIIVVFGASGDLAKKKTVRISYQ
jgi:hypothetical protein